MSVEQNEIDYTLNLKINDMDVASLQRLQPLLMRISADLSRVTGNKTGQEAIRELERLGRVAQETYMVVNAVMAAITPIDWVINPAATIGGTAAFFKPVYSGSAILNAVAMGGGFGISTAMQTTGGNV